MSFIRIPFVYLLLLPVLSITSCGDDDDGGGGDNTTVQQETACPDPSEIANIQSLLNNLSDDGIIEGSSTVQRSDEGGSTTTESFPLTRYDFSQVGENSWTTVGNRCNQNSECTETEATASLRNGCFFYDDIQANVNSATPNNLDFTTEGIVNGTPGTVNTSVSLGADGQVTLSEELIQNGITVQSLRFNGEADGSGGTTTGGTTTGGSTTGGSTTGGSTTGGSTTGGSTTGVTTTDGTTTGDTPNEPFPVPNHNCPSEEPVCPEGFVGTCEWEVFEDGTRIYHGMCYPNEAI